MISAENLLKPISTEKPCGEDISFDPALLELGTMLLGKPETQFSEAEPPDWRKIRVRCQELWQKSKNLRVATTMLATEVQSDGFPACREGLALLDGLVRNYWATLYPKLEATDGNDPTERVNIIASIAAPVGTFGDTLKLLQKLRDVPLINSQRVGRFSTSDILRAKSGKSGSEGKPPPSEAQIREAFKDTPGETVTSLKETLAAASKLVASLEEALTSVVGAEKAVSLAPLKREVDSILEHVSFYSPAAEARSVASSPEQQTETGAKPGEVRLAGNINSRAQAIEMLEKVRQYYLKNEPSSPVPFVLQHAQRLAEMDFLQIIDDLAQDATKDVQKVIGVKASEQPKEGA